MQNCSKSIANYCFKHKTSSASGGFAPDHHWGLCPLDLRWGSAPDPVILELDASVDPSHPTDDIEEES